MKKPLFLFLLLTGAIAAFAAADAVAPASEADAAYAELRAVRTATTPRLADVVASSALQMKQHDQSSRLAEKFLDRFPNDPRKWEATAWAVNSPRTYAPGEDAEKTAWQKRGDELRHALLEGKDVPDNLWVFTAERTIDDNSGFRETPVRDLAWAGRIVEQMRLRVPASSRRKFSEESYLDALAARDSAATEAFLRTRLAPAETNQAVADMAAGRLRVIDAKRAPLELKFTAADGRAVDLAQLRGKVVLIDFWATWCVPCMQEMPTVRAAYKKFHDQGFEVIGISFDKAPGEKPRAMEKTAAQVVQFTQENDMPWPHYYDGKYWNNEFGVRFSIASIPATFLIGKDGRLVTTEAHGEQLAAEVERLLKR